MAADDEFCLLNSSISSSCSSCFYGPFCQFTTAYYSILSIQSLFCSIQSIPISIILSVFFFGSLCNLFAVGTFCQSNAREMGSGIYRLWISIIGQLGLTIVVIHTIMEKNNSGKIGCFIFEYVRKVLHASYDSLTACTTLERTMVIYQGITFNKMYSRRLAKLIIPSLIFYHFTIILYEPFNRELIYSMNRYWCLLKFPNQLLVNFETITNIYHFIVPYLINLILPMYWILVLTKNKSALNKHTSIWVNFKNVLFSHKHAIISCYIFVLFNTPRFISTFYLTCIKLRCQNTTYITAYFLSLVPFMINLFIFVLPSPKHRPEFLDLVQRITKYRFRSQYIST
ncbi:unnamed protein product [Rotaria magnacalcarata]|uniref:Uncharacterized protein n=1 Tax=Rotaria magnacalcarata TaxID=392030 RepID=A0A816DTU9_9BILA|nr:unnamed protein product [Rotaria magnacalcarata]CAF4411511.1 unnamed protein product [Rotaria magnacalcarata]